MELKLRSEKLIVSLHVNITNFNSKMVLKNLMKEPMMGSMMFSVSLEPSDSYDHFK
jgi:hypothetical protein